MSGNGHVDPQAIHASLSHPVIDSDGHWLEFGPEITDRLRAIGGEIAVRGFAAGDASVAKIIRMTPEQRAAERRAQQAWWAFPTKNTRDRATAMLPKLLHERLPELGFDFSVLYPTSGLGLPFNPNDEERRAACRAFNTYIAESFHPYADRLTPAAVIPMNTPEEAIAELEHAIGELGLKVAVMGSLIRRPVPARVANGERSRGAVFHDVLGIDSPYDYDPVWAKCLELKVAPTLHSGSRGFGLKSSPSNFTYNHIGHFAQAGEAVCKAIFIGGVTRRFPALKFGFLEGGAGWACQLYADLIGHWKKRGIKGLEDVNPANLDRQQLRELFQHYAGQASAERLNGWSSVPEGDDEAARWAAQGAEVIDDYAACEITKGSDFRELFTRNFYFGCEADDPLNAWAFNSKVNPYGAKLKILFGSDIGHFDVPDMSEVLLEAHELVDEGLITQNEFRDFVFTYPIEFWAGTNPAFFKGTAVEKAVEAELQRIAAPAEAAPAHA
ncbi:MAG: amidohydrolase family protein [Candidatus Binataceae bacterium]|jgi:predicted TIM-barrel fold metal-dependent hydrolase